jgi:hypothetical protein
MATPSIPTSSLSARPADAGEATERYSEVWSARDIGLTSCAFTAICATDARTAEGGDLLADDVAERVVTPRDHGGCGWLTQHIRRGRRS